MPVAGGDKLDNGTTERGEWSWSMGAGGSMFRRSGETVRQKSWPSSSDPSTEGPLRPTVMW